MNLTSIGLSFRALFSTCLLAAAFGAAPSAHASIVVAGTRVIYNADAGEVTVKLTNLGDSPGLAQVWIDNGDPKAAPSAIATPFIVTPPVSRIDSSKAQTLRIFYTGKTLPTDKESVFYLNVLEIPPKPTGDDVSPNRLQFAFRTRIKLFFRPAGLHGSAVDAAKQLVWKWTDTNGKPGLLVSNPGAYHVTVASFEVLNAAGAPIARSNASDMIEPGASKVLPVSAQAREEAGGLVRYHSINDYGGEDVAESRLQ